MSEAGFAGLMQHIVTLADRCCGGRVVVATEGGYDLSALRASLDACLDRSLRRSLAARRPHDAVRGRGSSAELRELVDVERQAAA